MRLLIVDDDRLVAAGLTDLLAALGHEAAAAATPDQALSLLRAESFDALLVDWTMPGGGGQVVLKNIADGTLARTPAAILTGLPLALLPQAVQTLPVLHKPFRLAQLKALLDRLAQGEVLPCGAP